MSEELKSLIQPHIDSFDFFTDHGIDLILKSNEPLYFEHKERQYKIKFTQLKLGKPVHNFKEKEVRFYPNEAREAGVTYDAPFKGEVSLYEGVDSDEPIHKVDVDLGRMPIMVKSRFCHLNGLSSEELIEKREEELEQGGYFIVNGNEKVVRMLVMTKANHPVALHRKAWTNRGPGYTKFGITIRCVRPDRTSITNNLHYISDGQITLRFLYRRQEFFLPATLLLKALKDTTEREIYENLVQGDNENTFLTDRVELSLREQKINNINTQEEVLDYIGSRFRARSQLPSSFSNTQIGQWFIDSYVFVHLPNYKDKYNLLVLMIQKLYSMVAGKSGTDNIDSAAFHEVLLAGQIFGSILGEKLTEYLESTRSFTLKHFEDKKKENDKLENVFKKTVEKNFKIGDRFNYFLATGNLRSNSGLDLQQTSGFVVIADKLNFLRFISHFRSIHRGAFFATMKTTSIRKLMPESWGFLCPVHTPDGAPCGLLNHLTSACLVTVDPLQDQKVLKARPLIPSFLATHGMLPIDMTTVFSHQYLTITLDGCVIGKIEQKAGEELVTMLRYLRSVGTEPAIPKTIEISYSPPSSVENSQYPGISLFTSGARFMRPVINLTSGKEELIGPQEQLYMEIAVVPNEVIKGVTTHIETSPTAMFSLLANLTPFSDYNQSPRNMYQCQMAKQTMGTPLHSYPFRTDNKLYKIQNIQKPIVHTKNQFKYRVNDYAHGCNAVIAVISNTGYDMEDAMIINKSAYERGFGHGSVYKNEYIDLDEGLSRFESKKTFFGRPNSSVDNLGDFIDVDGLPFVGRLIKPGEPYYTYIRPSDGKQVVKDYKGKEEAYIEEVRILFASGGTGREPSKINNICVKLRYNRNPVIGDKFSSRHGQKGVLSQLWPEVNMPFTESGMKPDVIINPNAFPSRMTIGMLVEILAGKAGAIHGKFQDATAFQFDEKNTAIDFFGEQLSKSGFNRFGNETMYSGTTGKEFEAEIFFGVCYYQRLRHMVKDKYQVRALGKVNALTRQPIKGRKVGGGIRFGEMERDSLLAHGASFCLNDRLMKSSDFAKIKVCKLCGSTLTIYSKKDYSNQTVSECKACKSTDSISIVSIPYVFTYLVAELAAVNITMKLTVN
ncbi:RNA polymerase I, second largest subunit [Dictyostelium purpureum]|uniref:DNA-directed RNA polymerase subunit beta n=1 Tax=Dictyostelium purpureum TaxID=5786 RepID=F0ZVX5_DICPU|nr:RNA polymerase I, second largest subunit [Dictyostelium purpureum]EGC31907.1 RNA polymerase I, second largest subunit [Dictyostelium purpureum]|eukprot:XP_003291577.1 RNA polymerase I, second largest subunit [Dictyostelium purpureum]